jgi:hypothetical protein
VEALKQAVLEFRDEIYKKKAVEGDIKDSHDILLDVLGSDSENINESNVDLIYKHISARAT